MRSCFDVWLVAAIASVLTGSLCDALSVAVVPTLAGANEPSLASLYEVGARAIGERSCLVPRSFDDSLASGLASIVDRCGADAACIDQVLIDARAPAAVLLVVVRTKDRWLLSVRWQQPGHQPRVATETIDAEVSSLLDRSLAPLVRRILDDAGLERGARLDVSVVPRDARLELTHDGVAIPYAGDRALPKGKYELEVTADGFETARRTFELTPGQEINAHVALEADAAIYQEWWFWTAIGVVVAGSGIAVALAASKDRGCLCSAASLERCEMICEDF